MEQRNCSIAALAAIAQNTLQDFDYALLCGVPCAVPIEKLAGHLGLYIEYQCIRKTCYILGETIYEKTIVPVYFRDIKCYDLIIVDGKSIILDDSLLRCRNEGWLRFICAHEIAHWLIHRELYTGTEQATTPGNPKKSSEENHSVEHQANILATFLLLPTAQVEKAFLSVQDMPNPVMILKEYFCVSKKAIDVYMRVRKLR